MKKAIKILFGVSFVFYLIGLLYYLFLKSGSGYRQSIALFDYIKYSSNLIPFKTISLYIKEILQGYPHMNPDIPIKNLCGNIILFLPMGMYLPFFIKKIKSTSIFILILSVMLLLVELVQLLTRRGSFDIDDFILNLLGALIGFALWRTKAVQRIFS